jgi:signal transduction histidine kinase
MKKIFFYLLLLPVLANAQTIVWSNGNSSAEIGNKLEIFEDPSGKVTFDQITSPEFQGKFKGSNSINLSLGYTESFFWLRFTIDNQSSNNLILEVAQAGLPVTYLYYQTKSEQVHVKAGYQIPLNEKLVKSSFQVFSLPTGKNTYYIRLNSNSEPVPVRLHNPTQYEIIANEQKFSYGIYLGLMFFVVLNNLFFFASLKNRMHLFYSLIVLLYISYSAAVIDGYIVYFVPHADLIFLYTTIPAIGVTVQTIYCLLFLDVEKYNPKLFKAISGIAVYFALWSIAKFFFSFPIVQPINTVNALISFFVMGYTGVSVGRNGNKLGYYFACAYFIYFLLVAMQAIYINTGSPEYIGGLSHVAYATLVEAFLLSFLLSKRIEWEKNELEIEKTTTQQKLFEKTAENERIVRDQNVMLEMKVVERTREVEEKKQKLHELLHIIAHDLKSPFVNIKAVISLTKIKNAGFSNEEMVVVISDIATKAQGLIQKLLNTENFNQLAYNLKIENIDIVQTLDEIVWSLQNVSINKNILISFKPDRSNNYTASVDKIYLRQIFENLINNAIKFSPPDKHVYITLEEADSIVRTIVRDEGPGIKEEERDLVFKKYAKISNRPTAGESSTGLGLAIVKQYVELLNGKVYCESEYGNGCSFIVDLPRQNISTV